jgi:hypothetical protein
MSNFPSPEEWNASLSRIAELDAPASGLGQGRSGRVVRCGPGAQLTQESHPEYFSVGRPGLSLAASSDFDYRRVECFQADILLPAPT